MKRLAFLFCLLIIFSGCSISYGWVHNEAAWKTAPKINISYEDAWPILVNVVSEYFVNLNIDAQSGYLESGWRITDTCWAGLVNGGMVPCEKARVIINVEERNPFKVKIKVEQERMNMFVYTSPFHQEHWVSAGNNMALENGIMDALMTRFKKKTD